MPSIQDFIYQYEKPQSDILEYLHERISALPEVTSKIRYKIPFYYRKSWFCYLNPTKDGGIELAFTRGNELSNEQGLLSSRGRKQVYGVIFYDVRDIPEETLYEVLTEALVLDEEVKYASKRKKKWGVFSLGVYEFRPAWRRGRV